MIKKVTPEKKKIYDTKYRENPKNRMRHNLTSMFRRFNKVDKFIDILGVPFKEFILYIENKFEPWMTWDNYGLYNNEFNYGWEIDHIIPLKEYKNVGDVINHYTNLQPLDSKVNRHIKENVGKDVKGNRKKYVKNYYSIQENIDNFNKKRSEWRKKYYSIPENLEKLNEKRREYRINKKGTK